MKSGLISWRIATFFILSITAVPFAFAQTEEKTQSSVASYVRDADLDAGLVRRRMAAEKKAPVAPVVSFSREEISSFEQRVFELINERRVALGLGRLSWSEDVARVARLHSVNMADNGFFSHRGLDGKMVDGRADSLGLSKWSAMGENIAFNRGFANPLETVVDKWLASTSHRDNMLSPRWKEAGIGIAVTADGTYYFTQVFINRK